MRRLIFPLITAFVMLLGPTAALAQADEIPRITEVRPYCGLVVGLAGLFGIDRSNHVSPVLVVEFDSHARGMPMPDFGLG